jgi:hypothetical protein
MYFLFSHLKDYIWYSFTVFSYLAYFYKYFDRKEWNVRHLHFLSCHNRGHAIFLSRQPLIILHSKLYVRCLPFEISRSLKTFKTSTNQYLVSNEYFYVVNPCCDVTKTTVNEIKNLSKMADISLLQVKIFQELSKIWKIGKRS